MKYNRLFIVATNFFNNHSSAISNFLISFIVIKYATAALWGELTYYMALVQVLAMVTMWGSKDYLLKEFSLHPAGMNGLWKNNTLSRLVLLLPVCLFLYFSLPSSISILLIVWISSIFISKSYDVFIYYYKSFTFSLFLELISLSVLFILILYNRDHLDITYLLSSYMYLGLLKAIILMIFFRNEALSYSPVKMHFSLFVNATPFFVLAFFGILNARVDVFCINYFMNKESLGYYQVFLSFLLLIQGLGYLLVEPFRKNIYRLRDASFRKIKIYLMVIGPLVSFAGIISVYFILSYLYKIDLSFLMYVYGFLFCIPLFIYSMIVYKLFKFHQERWVIYVSALCLTMNVTLNFFAIPVWGLMGVIFSGMLVQWGKLLLFTIIQNSLSIKLKSNN